MCCTTEPVSALPHLLDKADFLKSLHSHQVSAFVWQHWPYTYFPWRPSISTKTSAFLTLPCPAFSTMDMKPQDTEKQYCSDSKGAGVEEADNQGADAPRDMLDSMGRPVSPSFSVQFGLPMLRVRSIWETGWEWRWSSITVTRRNKWQ